MDEPTATAPALDVGTDPPIPFEPPRVKGPGASPRHKRKKYGGRKKGSPHSRVSPELAKAAREYSMEALALYVRFMRNPKLTPDERIKAADRILDRGYGRPKERIELAKILDLGKLTDEQLDFVGTIYEALGLLPGGGQLAGPAPARRVLDGTATEILPP